MDAHTIGLVFARTVELRSKITHCIGETTSSTASEASPDAENPEDDSEEVKSLLNIRDAFESLEARLSALQALQRQQWYEKESALAQIKYIQEKLLEQLKEYKGKELEVIHEAMSFASETEQNHEIVFPPYPNQSFNGYSASFPFAGEFFPDKNTMNGLDRSCSTTERQAGWKNPIRGVKALICTVAKTALTIVAVITILSLTGLEPSLRKRNSQFKLSNVFQLQNNINTGAMVECPAGKVPVTLDGETRCVVKERVEIPFEPAVATPDVNYGCG